MTLHLFIPGLLARLPEWQRDYGWTPHAPALQALLSGASRASADPDPATGVAGLLGVRGSAAAFRRLGQGDTAQPGWFCADPVHLRTDVDSAVLIEAEHLGLALGEARQLRDELLSLFAADGWCLEVGDATYWYALPPAGLLPPPLPAVALMAGEDVGNSIRTASQSTAWKQFYAELQMLLTQSTINLEREARGQSAINALWFWGAGEQPRVGRATVASVLTGEPVQVGMAHAAGVPVAMPEPQAALSAAGDALVYLDTLRGAAAYDDIEAWEQALAELDARWFAPLVQALEHRQVDAIALYADGTRWQAGRRRGLARWRREQPLTQSLGLEAVR
ncbi:hypothetical protein [Acidihalobacter ferrooxydans]|nr:hypothetical protein [Acidihalobacter ferrooxydans]